MRRWRLARITREGTEILPDRFWTRRGAQAMSDFLNARHGAVGSMVNALSGWSYFPVNKRGVRVLESVKIRLTEENGE